MNISVQNVSKKIKNNEILKNISVEFESGNIYGIRGKNGSGKTMLIKAICGLIKTDEGRIIVDGKVIGKDMDFPESIGVLIENPGFPGGLKAFDNLKVIASIKNKITDKDIEEALIKVGLERDLEKRYRQYSLGMRQKLGIAAAIMEHPDIILLDEPTNGLDDESVMKLQNILKTERDKGALIIVVSHDFEELEILSNEIYQMKEGCLENIH